VSSPVGHLVLIAVGALLMALIVRQIDRLQPVTGPADIPLGQTCLRCRRPLAGEVIYADRNLRGWTVCGACHAGLRPADQRHYLAIEAPAPDEEPARP
jgi:hypothetical protein